MNLPPELRRLIDDRVRSGKYQTAEDVIAAAVSSLEQQEQGGEFDEGELDRLLADGENSGAPLDAEEVFKEL